MSDQHLNDCIKVGNMARDVRDTVKVIRLALQGDPGGLTKEEAAAVHHVAAYAERQAEDAVNLADMAKARLGGPAHG